MWAARAPAQKFKRMSSKKSEIDRCDCLSNTAFGNFPCC